MAFEASETVVSVGASGSTAGWGASGAGGSVGAGVDACRLGFWKIGLTVVGSPLIVALDRPDLVSSLALADQLNPQLCRLKVGKELFTACGPVVIASLRERGFDVFLDLKFHDIPNTTAAAVTSAARHGACRQA